MSTLEVGNNVQLAAQLGIEVEGDLEPGNPRTVGLGGCPWSEAMLASDFARRVQDVLGRAAPCWWTARALVRRIGWCTGGGQGFIDQAVAAGVDVFLSGEASEQTFHSARENGIGFIAAGHHATERYGVQALGRASGPTLRTGACVYRLPQSFLMVGWRFGGAFQRGKPLFMVLCSDLFDLNGGPD